MFHDFLDFAAHGAHGFHNLGDSNYWDDFCEGLVTKLHHGDIALGAP